MRINEDYIENIETDDISAEVEDIELASKYGDKESYKFSFMFRTRELDISDISEDDWKSIADNFYSALYRILDASPLIREYRHIFPLCLNLFFYESIGDRILKTIETDSGREI